MIQWKKGEVKSPQTGLNLHFFRSTFSKVPLKNECNFFCSLVEDHFTVTHDEVGRDMIFFLTFWKYEVTPFTNTACSICATSYQLPPNPRREEPFWCQLDRTRVTRMASNLLPSSQILSDNHLAIGFFPLHSLLLVTEKNNIMPYPAFKRDEKMLVIVVIKALQHEPLNHLTKCDWRPSGAFCCDF